MSVQSAQTEHVAFTAIKVVNDIALKAVGAMNRQPTAAFTWNPTREVLQPLGSESWKPGRG